jgi:hypothetical protein
MYTGFTLIALPALRSSEDGKSLVLFLLCAVWAGDIVAMYVGRTWGKHKLAPHLSPNKTWDSVIQHRLHRPEHPLHLSNPTRTAIRSPRSPLAATSSGL